MPGSVSAHPSPVVVALAISNGLFLLNTFCPHWWRDLRSFLYRATLFKPLKEQSISEEALHGLLGQDYVPPLPQPVADALDRSRLCFLATASKLEPHLSLMRFTYTAGLDPNEPNSEVCTCPSEPAPGMRLR